MIEKYCISRGMLPYAVVVTVVRRECSAMISVLSHGVVLSESRALIHACPLVEQWAAPSPSPSSFHRPLSNKCANCVGL